MIPQEVADLCRLICEDYDARDEHDPIRERALIAAWRIYRAGWLAPAAGVRMQLLSAALSDLISGLSENDQDGLTEFAPQMQAARAALRG